jgi:type IV pilus assembly protein PilE
MRRNSGFTLVEVLVVLAIMLVLGALVYPSYSGYIVKAHRVEAQVALLQTMQEQERYYSLHNAYLPFSADSSGEDERRFHWWLGATPPRSAYELSGRPCDNLPLEACIQLRAVPGTAKVDPTFRDPDCETLTLDSTGAHGAGGRRAGCWP